MKSNAKTLQPFFDNFFNIINHNVIIREKHVLALLVRLYKLIESVVDRIQGRDGVTQKIKKRNSMGPRVVTLCCDIHPITAM